jgi:hypothetical protein
LILGGSGGVIYRYRKNAIHTITINSLVKETLVRELSGVILVDAISLAGHTTVTGIVSYNSRNLVGVVRIELT